MSEQTTQPTSADPAPSGSDPTPAPAAPVVPEGYVPAAEVEKAREEARRRYQSELDRAKAEAERLKAAQSAASGEKDGGASGFDPDAFRQSLLRDVSSVLTLNQTVAQVRAEFPHADPALFSPDRLSQFGSSDALRLAAEDSHRRVTAILDAERAAMEAKLREELAAASGGSSGPSGGSSPPVTGDPTPEQLAAMPFSEYVKLPEEVIDRVMAKAGG